MHKRDLSPVERIKEPPEKFLKTLSSPAKFSGGESPNETDIESFEILPQCKSNEEDAKERLNGACSDERNKQNCTIQMEQENRKRKSEYILKMVKKKQLHQRPPYTLLELIIKAITSAPEGYVTFCNIYNYIADNFPFYQEKSHWWKKCIHVTLKRNRKSFIHIPASKGNRSLQNDIWTIHPMAAARFVNDQTKSDSRKESHTFHPYYDVASSLESLRLREIPLRMPHHSMDETSGHSSNISLLTRSEPEENLVSSMETGREDTLLKQVTNQGSSQDGSVPKKCREENQSGTEQLKQSKNEVTKRPIICDAPDKSVVGFVQIERSILIDRLAKVYKRRQINNSQTINSTANKEITNPNSKKEWRGWPEPNLRSKEKRKLVQSIVEETKCMVTSSLNNDVMEDEEIVPYEPEKHKEQELVTKGCEQTRNLISSLLKAVEVLDNKQALEQEGAATALNQMQEGSGFIGFDHDLWSGSWRGWERVSTRRRDQVVALVSRLAGSLDLATVLADCRQTVNCILQELEKHNTDSKDQIKKEKRRISYDNEDKYLVEKIQNQIKDLMKCIPNKSSEPPFSYTVLTVMALASSLDTSLPVPDIHRFIEDTFPFYRGNSEISWKHSIELILQLNNAFVKACQGLCGRKSPDHGGCWRVRAKSAGDILGRALHRENEIQKKKQEYKQSKENKENNNDNITSVLKNGEVNEKQSTNTKEKTAKTSVNLNNTLNSDGHQKGMRRNSVIVSTFDLEKPAKQEFEHVDGTELRKSELPNRKTLTFESNTESHIVNASCDSYSVSETSLNRSEGGLNSESSGSSNQTVSSSSSDSSTVSEKILKLAAEADISEGSEPSVTQSEQNVSSNTDSEESVVSINTEDDPETENKTRRTHSTQYSVKDIETCRTSEVTGSQRETLRRPSVTSEEDRTPPGPTITKTVGNSRNIQSCQMCSKQFSCLFLFDHHSCFHSRYNSFACYICHVAFKNSCLLWGHLNSLHSGAHNHHLVSSLCLTNNPDRNERDRCPTDEVAVESLYKRTVERVPADKVAVENLHKRTVERVPADEVAVESLYKRTVERVPADKVAVESLYKRTVERVPADEVAVESQYKRTVERVPADEVAVESQYKRTVERVPADEVAMESLYKRTVERVPAGEVAVESRYKCTACLAVFLFKHKLDSHKKMFHSDIFMFECNFCRPAQLFRNKHKYQHHLATRHPSNYPLQYVCQVCKARFDAEEHLDKHVMMFHCKENEPLPAKSKSLPLEDFVFVCYSCKSCFECKQSLLSHSCPCKA